MEKIIFFRYGTIFREVINSGKREWCDIMSGKSSNPLMKAIIGQLTDSVPHLFRKCPYEGILDLKNITVNDGKSVQAFPQGVYAVHVKGYRSNAETLTVKLNLEIKSPIKETFG